MCVFHWNGAKFHPKTSWMILFCLAAVDLSSLFSSAFLLLSCRNRRRTWLQSSLMCKLAAVSPPSLFYCFLTSHSSLLICSDVSPDLTVQARTQMRVFRLSAWRRWSQGCAPWWCGCPTAWSCCSSSSSSCHCFWSGEPGRSKARATRKSKDKKKRARRWTNSWVSQLLDISVNHTFLINLFSYVKM